MHVIKQIYNQIMNYLHLVGARIRLIYFFGNESYLLGIFISYTIWSSPKMHFALKGKKDLLFLYLCHFPCLFVCSYHLFYFLEEDIGSNP